MGCYSSKLKKVSDPGVEQSEHPNEPNLSNEIQPEENKNPSIQNDQNKQNASSNSGSDSHRKRYSLPQVEHHIKSIVKQYADDEFEEELNAFQAHAQSSVVPTTSANLSLTGKSLDWNQVMNEFMGSESPVVSAAQLSPLRVTTQNISLNDSIFDDEFNLDSPGVSKTHNFLSNITATSMDSIILTLEFQLSPNNDPEEGYIFPIPTSSANQIYKRYHSFNPKPIFEEIRKVGLSYGSGYDALYCRFEPDVKEVKYSIDLDVSPSRTDTTFCIGKNTLICICDDQSEPVQEIVRQQKWLQTESKEERIRQIAEYVGQLPYHLNLYDQIYYYLDSSQPSNHEGLRTVFHLFLSASNIKESVDLSNLTGYIFPNLRESIFVKICFKDLVKIEILNKTRDNELETIYL